MEKAKKTSANFEAKQVKVAEISEKLRDAARRIYIALGCRCLSRVDFFVTQGDSPEIVFNEINTIPGFTHISMYPKLFEACGIPYSELLDRLVAYASEK